MAGLGLGSLIIIVYALLLFGDAARAGRWAMGRDNVFWRHAAPDTGETVTQAEDLHIPDTFTCSTSFIDL